MSNRHRTHPNNEVFLSLPPVMGRPEVFFYVLISRIPRDLGGYAHKPPDVGARLVPARARGSRATSLKGEREGASPSLLQAFYTQWLAEIPRDLVKNP